MDEKKTRLYEKSSYSSRTISIYQIVGAYFVDVYYNHIYAEAIKFKNSGRVNSITEGYRHGTFAFLSALDSKSKSTYKPSKYNTLLVGINEYFIKHTCFSSLTLGECMDKIVREFIPDDYFKALDNDQKRNVLRKVLTNTLREFTKVVIEEFLLAIIDNHEELENIEAMKERIVDLFIDEREKIFHDFITSHSNTSNDKVDRKFAEKMKAEIIKLNEEKLQLLALIKSQKEEIDVRKGQLSKVLTKYRKVEGNYKNVLAEYRVSREKAEELEEQYKITQNELNTQREYKEQREKEHEENIAPINSSFMDVDEIQTNQQLKASKSQTKTKVQVQKQQPLKPIQRAAKLEQPLKPTTDEMDKLINSHVVKQINGGVEQSANASNKQSAKPSLDPTKSRYVQLAVDKTAEEESDEEESEPNTSPQNNDENSNSTSNAEINTDSDYTASSNIKINLGTASKLSDIY
jgi:hypothetical protein